MSNSGGPGKGATFRVLLPPAATMNTHAVTDQDRPLHHAAAMPDQTPVTPSIGLEGVKVLVVDDEPDARSLIERLLQDCDATVTTVASAKEALEVLARDQLDVLISDIGMPKEDGYTLIRHIRRLKGDNRPGPRYCVDGLRARGRPRQSHRGRLSTAPRETR